MSDGRMLIPEKAIVYAEIRESVLEITEAWQGFQCSGRQLNQKEDEVSSKGYGKPGHITPFWPL